MIFTARTLTLLLEKRGMCKAEAARRCDYTPTYFAGMTNGHYPVNKGASLRIVAGLEVTPEEFDYLNDNE